MRKSQSPKAPRRKYDRTADREEFKNEAVRLVTTCNRSVPDVARSLGISENLLYRWKGYSKPNGEAERVSQQDYDQLREQLRRTEQERDILKSLYSAPAVE